MALKSTVHKVQLHIADMDRHYYAEHALTVARHPSENDERMMVRLLAFARHGHDMLAFGRGVSTDDEPDIWQKDLTGAINLWVQLGQPDEKQIRKACGRARSVFLYTYSGHSAAIWWGQHEAKLAPIDNLAVIDIAQPSVQALAALVCRNLELSCTIQEGQVWMADQSTSVEISMSTLKTIDARRKK